VLDIVPDALGPRGEGLHLQWEGPGGHRHGGVAAILVSNNVYRLGRAVGSGTRPRIDDGLLGITVFGGPFGTGADGTGPQRPWRAWTAPAFEVRGDRTVAVGIDGEAARPEPPLRFRIHPAALRVRISRGHPGDSPSALQPHGAWEGIRALASIVAGRDLRRPPPRTPTPANLASAPGWSVASTEHDRRP